MRTQGYSALFAETEGTRAALNAARAVFAPVISGSAVDASAQRAVRMWSAVESVLRAVTERADLNGQALVREASRLERLSLEGAHALIALHGWQEQTQAPTPVESTLDDAPSDTERRLATDALAALDFAVTNLSPTPTTRTSKASSTDAPPLLAPPAAWDNVVPPSGGIFRSPGVLLAILAAVLLGGTGAWYVYGLRQKSTAMEDGLAAYQRGSRETARIAFAKAAQEQPDDVRPLVYLGRIARDDGNSLVARRYLEAAVRVAPTSALANRELAGALLADGTPEIARRFYVRALQLDPTDRVAQGFLACALVRLGRVDESKRWSDRAGPGDWTSCVNDAPPPPPPTPPASR